MPIPAHVSDRLKAAGPMMKIFLDVLEGRNTDIGLDQLRSVHSEGLQALPVPTDVDCDTVDMGGVPALRLAPRDVDDERTLLYMHGGAYIVGDWWLIVPLAQRSPPC